MVLDWNLENDKGNPIKYTPKTALKYFMDPNFERLRNACAWAAIAVMENDKEAIAKVEAKEAKNSKTSSRSRSARGRTATKS